MMQFILNHRFFVIGFVLTVSLLWPLVFADYFSHHDDVQVIRLHQMNKCISDFQIPCRWVPDLGGLYGYPLFNYYAPLPYYVGEIFYLISGSLIISAKLMFALAFVGSYIFMYLLGRKVWGELGGSLSAIFYSFAPYHAVDLYVRGAMAELWGLMLMPAILWIILRLFESPKISNVLALGFFIAALITSHNLTTMMFLPAVVVFSLVLLFIRHRKISVSMLTDRFLAYLLLGGLLGLLLSGFYWIPALVEKDLVHVDTTTSGYFSYTEHFKGLRKLILDNSWGWGASIREVPGGEKDGMSFQVGWIHLMGLILAIYGFRFLKKERTLERSVLVFSILAVFGYIFMVHPRSKFVWDLIPAFKYIQFPWRFLNLIILFVSLSIGVLVLIKPPGFLKIQSLLSRWPIYLWTVLVFLVCFYSFSFFRPEKFLDTTDVQLLSGMNWDKQIKRSIFDYLPKSAAAPPAELAISRYEILTGESEISNFKEGSDWIMFDTQTKKHTIIRLSQYYFPNFKVFDNNQEIHVDYENSLGLLTFILGEGQHSIYAKLYNTPVRILANSITVIGFTIFFVVLILQIPKAKKWIKYYVKGANW